MKATSFLVLVFFLTQVFLGCQEVSSEMLDEEVEPTESISVTNSNPKPLTKGEWGGQGIELSITKRGASFKISCAQGVIKQRVAPDSEGNFQNTGWIRFMDSNQKIALFEGVVSRDTMELFVTWEDSHGQTQRQAFVLRKGQTAGVVQCRGAL